MRIAAVIPIKTKNQRLPGKNTKVLGDKPLMNHLFDTLKNNELISEIFINSSDPNILKEATLYNYTSIQRPIELNGPHIQANDLLQFELNYIDYPIIVELFVTSPFLTNNTINKAIKILIDNNDIDSVFGVSELYNRYWINNETPLNHDPYKLIGTQYMKPIYGEANFYVFRKRVFLQENSRITKRHRYILVNKLEAIDIDDEIDFTIAEYLYKEKLKK